jgi:hypothetical protein
MLVVGCVDRIDFETNISEYPIVVEGYISDQPGPYEIRVSRSFDVQSKGAQKTSISVKGILLSDNLGNEELLSEVQTGIYRTSELGIQGVVGRIYKIKVELLDGRIFESTPDTLLPAGSIESVRHEFFEETNQDFSKAYGFDIFFDAKGPQTNSDFLWRVKGTYQIETNPELYEVRCGESKCASPRGCSGYVAGSSGIQKVAPCTCCTCWVDFYSNVPIVSSRELVTNSIYKSVKAYRLPLEAWYFMNKVRIEIQQLRLSPQALSFWRAIKAQKESTNSLFQPVSGIIPSNFLQTNGSEGKLQGFFFATAISSKAIFITRHDVPSQSIIPNVELPYKDSCLGFPKSANVKPSFWE